MTELPVPESYIHAFAELGNIMRMAAKNYRTESSEFVSKYPELLQAMQAASLYNPWFTPSSVASALDAWGQLLTAEEIGNWLKPYCAHRVIKEKTVAVVMAGNIPVVGFHDFMCVLLSGNNFIGKLSGDDKILLPALAEELCKTEPAFREKITFTESTLKGFDAIIATGSNNTARYFEYYFANYPHIIRKNRNGVAVLTGQEDESAIMRLGSDICSYFGLGCRNVSKVFIPAGYAPENLFAAIEPYNRVLNDHYKYMNNYSYYRSILLLNQTPHLDNNVFILTESTAYTSPIPVLNYEFYDDLNALKNKLMQDDELIQCIATDAFTGSKTVKLGHTQNPGLNDYADGIDTMKFLMGQ